MGNLGSKTKQKKLGEGMSVKATWQGVPLAESSDIVVVEGNDYFPMDSLNKQYFSESNYTTSCPWKGEAKYFDITVEGKTNKNAAWYYPEPKEAAASIKDRVAFWKGVEVESDRSSQK